MFVFSKKCNEYIRHISNWDEGSSGPVFTFVITAASGETLKHVFREDVNEFRPLHNSNFLSTSLLFPWQRTWLRHENNRFFTYLNIFSAYFSYFMLKCMMNFEWQNVEASALSRSVVYQSKILCKWMILWTVTCMSDYRRGWHK
jgi:hypothetical protein